jgi:acid phosphatase (class A)
MKRSVWALVAILACSAASLQAADDKAIQNAISRMAKGYLAPGNTPDATVFLSQPPAVGSSAMARDEDAAKAALALRGGPRWELAKSDADVFSPKATGVLSCTAGFEISPDATPKLDNLMRRTLSDFGLATRGIKAKYQRPRPFMVNGEPNCTPDWDAVLRKDGSFPSGHATIGFGWGLLLAELVPDRAAQMTARGRAFADSRRICNVHWLSDTEEGALAATATLARLHADAAFQKDMQAVRKELAAKAIKARKPTRDCAAEAAALAIK